MRNTPERVYGYLGRRVAFSSVDLTAKDISAAELQITIYEPSVKKIKILGNTYYTLPDSAAKGQNTGQSAKILLVSEQHFSDCITNKTKITSDAILKLPKHGDNDIAQVQNEAMALGISTALGLTTTSATMVIFENKPALFIPFDNIEPLTKLAKGDIPIPMEGGRVDYEDSTIDPLGNGLSANEFIDDFGKAFALMYLTGDPDAVGGYDQNKAIQGRSLYVFDQAIVSAPVITDIFSVTSSLRNKPSYFASISRHTRGRNFFLLEDASIASKFDSLSQENCEKVLQYIDSVIGGLIERRALSREEYLLDTHSKLLQTAINAKELIVARIEKYRQVLPRAEDVDNDIVKSALVFENILNKPRLYSTTGRPYRSLMTAVEHDLKITEIYASGDLVTLKFNIGLSSTSINMLNSIGDILLSHDGKTITMDKNKLENLEQLIYPEKNALVKSGINYLSNRAILFIAESYRVNPTACLKITNRYLNKYHKAGATLDDKVALLENTRRSLNHFINDDDGFRKHIVKKFELEIQKQLRRIIKESSAFKKENKQNHFLEAQSKAFSCAAKLDLIEQFNDLCIFIAINRDNPRIINESQQLLAKYAWLDLQETTLESAKSLREEMQRDMDAILKPSLALTSTEIFRSRVSDIKKRGETTEEVLGPIKSSDEAADDDIKTSPNF